MRAPVFFSSWLKCTLWSRTAENAFTGTLTSPKLIDPLQIALAMGESYPAAAGPMRPAGGTGRRGPCGHRFPASSGRDRVRSLTRVTEGVEGYRALPRRP